MADDKGAGDVVTESVREGSESAPSVLWQPLTGIQTVVGTAAGLIFVARFVASMLSAGTPAPTHGDLLAVIHDARLDRPILDATIEVSTLDNNAVTTLISRDEGRARLPLRDGQYRVRVRHPKFNTEALHVQVTAGQTSELHIALAPLWVPPPPKKPVAARQPGAFTRFFQSLGF
jgi:hypothetical protein